MRFLLYICCALFLFWAVASSEIIKNFYSPVSDGVNITVHWTTADESDVALFEVERSDDGVNFISVGSVSPQGITDYYFVDHSVFKKTTSLYYYRLKITLLSDRTTPVYTQKLQVAHSVSGVRRTWGSIKSMFRF
jgi:hypothetical protein